MLAFCPCRPARPAYFFLSPRTQGHGPIARTKERFSAAEYLFRRYGPDAFANRKTRCDVALETRQVLFGSGNWIQFPFDFARITTANVALLLAFLCNHSRLHAESVTNSDGWFFCRVSTLQHRLGWDRQKQWREIDRLQTLGYLEAETRGQPSKRYLRLKWAAIRRDCREDRISDCEC